MTTNEQPEKPKRCPFCSKRDLEKNLACWGCFSRLCEECLTRNTGSAFIATCNTCAFATGEKTV